METPLLSRIIDYTHFLMFSFLPESGIVVDCTCGNGKDLLFLIENGSDEIEYFGFDIQTKAIENTKKSVANFSQKKNIRIIKDSHANIDKYFSDKQVDMFVYNLGWLPGENSNRDVTTVYESTLKSVKKAMDLIKLKAVIIITSYKGHKEGRIEYDELKIFLKDIDNHKFRVLRMEYDNAPNKPPSIFVIQKIKD